MEPFERFKKLISLKNLWIYIISLAKEKEIPEKEVRSLIFEKFGFLPDSFTLKRVLFQLKRKQYLFREKYKGEPAIKASPKGIKELEKMKTYFISLLKKLESLF